MTWRWAPPRRGGGREVDGDRVVDERGIIVDSAAFFDNETRRGPAVRDGPVEVELFVASCYSGSKALYATEGGVAGLFEQTKRVSLQRSALCSAVADICDLEACADDAAVACMGVAMVGTPP